MSNRKYTYVLFMLCLAFVFKGYSQDSTFHKVITLPDKLFISINKKATALEGKLDKQTDKYLSKLQKQERRLKKKLSKKDSLLAGQLFSDAEGNYRSLQSLPQSGSKYSSVYSGHLDSLSTALSFLKNSNLSDVKNNRQLEKTLQNLEGLQARFNQTDQVKKYLQQRQQLLKEQLQKLGMLKELKKYQKQVYYYQAQLKEYKQLFEDPNKLEAKLMEVAMKVPQFKDFFARNSQLGSLFALPTSNGGSSASLKGLQTRAMLNEQLAQRFGSGVDVTKMLQQNVQGAQSQLSELKNKVNQYTSGSYGNTSSEIEQPDFKPNQQKTKTFLKRLEYGGNIQSQKARSYFPVNSDVAATLGYKLSDKSAIGIGAAYKIGWGSGIQHIRVTHQGLGLRSYVDLKLKGSFYVSGGYELNYLSIFKSVEQLKNNSAWQKSGLVGLTKKYKVSKKIKGNMQLLWDFLSNQQVPKTQAVLFRIGYCLK
ncbi:hypothetical protein OCK74_18665 [Chitinophagaceae bacterium LB-8]|uniref:Uncharacterized protein n=1 Tax=Paraflavisolibacter caeni TaxID=2982496 RepID=A0A9X3B8S2_9BACT|nr:hypothetical protein [Paraflavisolibacter caeni]MCU7551150.1 hypothetical protein [Paraflavisolibacter caeni]